MKVQHKDMKVQQIECGDQCPLHGKLSTRGRSFSGIVMRKFPKRVMIQFERTLYIRKYERYAKAQTRIHARLPRCLEGEVQVGDLVQVRECRPLSRIIHFVVLGGKT